MGVSTMEFKDLVFGYDQKIILNGVNLKFDEPGLVCILGPNGVGKTTLVKCGNKLLKPTSGDALVAEYTAAIIDSTRQKIMKAIFRFVFLRYDEATVTVSDSCSVIVVRDDSAIFSITECKYLLLTA